MRAIKSTWGSPTRGTSPFMLTLHRRKWPKPRALSWDNPSILPTPTTKDKIPTPS